MGSRRSFEFRPIVRDKRSNGIAALCHKSLGAL